MCVCVCVHTCYRGATALPLPHHYRQSASHSNHPLCATLICVMCVTLLCVGLICVLCVGLM